MNKQKDCLLLILPLRAWTIEGRLYTDTQACNGLRLWLENFETVILACPIEPLAAAMEAISPIDTVPGFERLTFIGLPVAYSPLRFLRALPSTIPVLADQISKADYLHFAIGGLFGDWASVACIVAKRHNLPFAIWTDRVESQVTRFAAKSKTGLRKLYTLFIARLMKYYERYLIKRCTLGLFHGMDCYEVYASYCPNPHLVHDIHLGKDALVTSASIAKRFSRSSAGSLMLAYAGRAHSEKGIYDWIEVLSIILKKGVDFQATWFGSGPELIAARKLVDEFGLINRVIFAGNVSDHSQLMQELQNFDAFLFCHKTLESPRCLIEALLCGLPLIGYETEYSKELINRNGGGLLIANQNVIELADAIILLSQDRLYLQTLTERAVKDGSHFSDEEVFRHRSDLMKTIRIEH